MNLILLICLLSVSSKITPSFQQSSPSDIIQTNDLNEFNGSSYKNSTIYISEKNNTLPLFENKNVDINVTADSTNSPIDLDKKTPNNFLDIINNTTINNKTFIIDDDDKFTTHLIDIIKDSKMTILMLASIVILLGYNIIHYIYLLIQK